MAKTLAPLDDRVVIKQDTAQEISDGGIFIPESAQSRETCGTVVAVGPGKFYDLYDFGGMVAEAIIRYEPMAVTVGNRVVYSKYAGAEVEILGETYQVMRQQDIVAIIGHEDDDAQIAGVG